MATDLDGLNALSVQLARIDERMIAMQRQMTDAVEQRDSQYAALKEKVTALATVESVSALAERIGRLESNWTWLIRSVIVGPALALLGWLVTLKTGIIVK